MPHNRAEALAAVAAPAGDRYDTNRAVRGKLSAMGFGEAELTTAPERGC